MSRVVPCIINLPLLLLSKHHVVLQYSKWDFSVIKNYAASVSDWAADGASFVIPAIIHRPKCCCETVCKKFAPLSFICYQMPVTMSSVRILGPSNQLNLCAMYTHTDSHARKARIYCYLYQFNKLVKPSHSVSNVQCYEMFLLYFLRFPHCFIITYDYLETKR